MARSFNGTSDVITTGNFNIPSVPITFACWTNGNGANFNNGGIGNSTMICAKTGASTGGMQVRINPSGGSSAQLVDSGIAAIALDAYANIIIHGTGWFLFAVTYDGATCIFYYGGIGQTFPAMQTSTISTSTTLHSNTHGYTLGASPAGGSDVGTQQFWPGFLADMAVWNAVLTPAEIKQLWRVTARPGSIRPSNLRSWWPLDDYLHPALDKGNFDGVAGNGVLTGTTFVPGPPLISPLPYSAVPFQPKSAAASGGAVFRRSLSDLGTRAGTRQVQAA